MAELLGERLLAWHAGLLVPFLIAAVIKTLQGSSLVAAITAAGMMQTALFRSVSTTTAARRSRRSRSAPAR